MDRSFSFDPEANGSEIAASQSESCSDEMPTVDFYPAEIVKHQTAHWRGVRARTVQLTSRREFEYRFQEDFHLLIAVEQGVRHHGETFIEGLPVSTMRNYSRRLMLVPAGRQFHGIQKPRLLTRSVCLYIDPQALLADPDLRFAEAKLEPRLLFEDVGLWDTVAKMKALIGSGDPSDSMYADALGGLLAHELLRLQRQTPRSQPSAKRGGLAPWQQKRVLEFINQHVTENIALTTLAELVRLSPYHFARAFKQSLGAPPHRYWAGQRVERAKELLADPRMSITEVAFDVGFAGSSAFSAAFRRTSGLTPTEYRRSLE